MWMHEKAFVPSSAEGVFPKPAQCPPAHLHPTPQTPGWGPVPCFLCWDLRPLKHANNWRQRVLKSESACCSRSVQCGLQSRQSTAPAEGASCFDNQGEE